MDQDVFNQMIPAMRDKVMGMLSSNFRRSPREDHEDAVQIALIQAFNRVNEFLSESGLLAYLYESAKLNMIRKIELDEERRAARQSLPIGVLLEPIEHDPTRRLDWKIDLERAIRRVTNDETLQTCLWENVYVGWTGEELAMKLPPSRSVAAWEEAITRARRALKREMRKGGYRGLHG